MWLVPGLLGIEDLISWLGVQLGRAWSWVLAGGQHFLGWLFDLGIALTGWLPDHAPIAWPDPGAWGVVFRGLGVVGRFVDLPVLFGVLSVGMAYSIAVMLYAVYRAILGFIPMAK